MVTIIHKQAWTKGDQKSIIVKDGGVVEVTTPCAINDFRDMIIRAILDEFRPVLPGGVYVRGTNNKDEIKMIEAGTLRPSRNHADNTTECGLSVANGAHYVGAMGYKYGYLVAGEVCGTGSDGENLLDLATLKPVSKMQKGDTLVSRDRKASSKIQASRGWTDEMMQAAIKKQFDIVVSK